MKLIGLVRLGRDAEVRQAGNTQVMSFAGAYNIGYGDKRESQWVTFSMFGDNMDRRASMLTKGTSLMVYASDVKVREFNKRDGGTGFSLEARLHDFEFAGVKNDAQQAGNAALNTAKQQKPSAQADLDDDIPF